MKIKEIKIVNQDESTEVADIGADAINVDYNETTVKAELDKLDTDNNTNKTNITNLQSQVSNLASGGPAGVYATITALTSADPDHSKIYVVTANGHWYYYNNGWQDGGVYQAAEDSNELKSIKAGYEFLFNKSVIPFYKELTYSMSASATSTNTAYGGAIVTQEITEEFQTMYIKYNLSYVGTDWTLIGVRINTLNSNNEIVRRIFIPGNQGSLTPTFQSNEVKFQIFIAGEKSAGNAYTENFVLNGVIYATNSALASDITVPQYDALNEKTKNNFADLSNVFIKYTRTAGYLAANGTLATQTSSKEYTSNYIDIQDYSSLYITLFNLKASALDWWAAVGCYNENKQWISRSNITLKRISSPVNYKYNVVQGVLASFPTNTKYVRVSYCAGVGDTIEMRLGFNEINGYIDHFPSLEDINHKIEQIPDFRVNYNFNASKNLKGINHRGFNTIAPENTIPAYKLSKENGFDFVECDIALTSDRVPVLLHDSTIDRTSNGTGNIIDLTFEQVRTYDFGSWKSSDYAGTVIPSFEEFIIFCRNAKLYPYIELKASTPFTQADIDNLIDIVYRYKMELNCTWLSFTYEYLEMVIATDKTARVLWLGPYDMGSYYINKVKWLDTKQNEFGFNISLDKYNAITSAQWASLKESKISLEVWVVDDESTILNINPYVSGITSNSKNYEDIIYNNIFD